MEGKNKVIRSRFEGALLGLAVGDALGAPVEFMKAREIAEKYGELKEMVGGGWLNLKPGEYTDDTAMMLCITESLVENREYNPDDIAQRFVRWLKSEPKDIGKTTRGALEKIAGGTPWMIAGNINNPTNGSVMRCAPIGLMYFCDEEELVRVSIETSRITHAHPDSIYGCVLINSMIANLVRGGKGRDSFICALSVVKRDREDFYQKIKNDYSSPNNYDEASGRAIDTALLAIGNFINTSSFEEAVVATVNMGGDSDTIGAVTGALAGAYWGASAIPERWSSKINPYSASQIKKLARILFEIANE